MRASSPALALVSRPIAVPRPRPRPVRAGDSPSDPEATREVVVPTRSDVAPRPTLRSVDLEYLGDVEPPRRSSVPPPLPDRARDFRRRASTPRTSHPELADAVFSALRDLVFFETPIEAAAFGVVTAMQVLPCLAGTVLLRQDDGDGYVAVYARGPHAYKVVRSRVAEDDPIVGLALVRGGSVSIEYGSDTPPPARHAVFGDPWSALVAPIQLEERCVGVLELIDPLDGRSLGESGRHALATIAQHLALFLRDRRLVVDGAFAPRQVGLED
jgi:hypothetical protein